MPKLTIVIGANGAGKSTWCQRHRGKRLPSDFYDADSIARGLGDWNSAEQQQAAREVVDQRVENHLAAKTDFGFESTYSGKSRPDIIRRAKALGYDTEAIFIGTTRPEINIKRVADRVRTRTGHHVATAEIQRRWTAARDNLIATANVLDRIDLIDNSGKGARTAVRIEHSRETGRAARVPTWAKELAQQLTTPERGTEVGARQAMQSGNTRFSVGGGPNVPKVPDRPGNQKASGEGRQHTLDRTSGRD